MNQIHNLSERDSVIHDFMERLRNVSKQTNRSLFRQNIRSIGRFIGYEVSKTLGYKTIDIQTPLARHEQRVTMDEIVVVTVLRAGLPLHEGILDAFPEAENGFISAYRKHEGDSFSIEVKYVACPDLTDKVVIINDPMLATGSSMITAWEVLRQYGEPKRVILAAVIASEEGVSYVRDHALGAFDLWIAAVDKELNEQKYIVPGLGDAGDLSYGEKLQH
ncbi:MAG: uracil phosphoribosyltransferase [Cryomorphaceae bacterium]